MTVPAGGRRKGGLGGASGRSQGLLTGVLDAEKKFEKNQRDGGDTHTNKKKKDGEVPG